MEITERLSLIQPRPSPKMERIYAALQEGWPTANINHGLAKQYVVWGLIGDNPRIMKEDPYIVCDMPYNG